MMEMHLLALTPWKFSICVKGSGDKKTVSTQTWQVFNVHKFARNHWKERAL